MEHTFQEEIIVTVLDKALIGGLLALAGYWLNTRIVILNHVLGLDAARKQLTLQSQIKFKETQLAEFYGPAYALLKRIRPVDDLRNQGRGREIDMALKEVIYESNNRVVELILNRAHLIRGAEIPPSYTRFLTHVAVWHAFLKSPDPDWSAFQELPEAHYRTDFEEDIFRTTKDLKQELENLYQEYGLRSPSHGPETAQPTE
jgi:hypothetical protein